MTEFERYEIALKKSNMVQKMDLPAWRKDEICCNLGKWIHEKEKGIDELPFPFGTKPRKI